MGNIKMRKIGGTTSVCSETLSPLVAHKTDGTEPVPPRVHTLVSLKLEVLPPTESRTLPLNADR